MAYNDNNRDTAKKKMHFSPNLLSCINNALDNKILVTIEYESRENEATNRQIEPMDLVYKNSKRNLVGWCRLRNDWRSFRLDRIEMIKLHKDTFTLRDGFNVADFEGDDDFTKSDEEED